MGGRRRYGEEEGRGSVGGYELRTGARGVLAEVGKGGRECKGGHGGRGAFITAALCCYVQVYLGIVRVCALTLVIRTSVNRVNS